ncbi:MAG TPA: DUF4430 domain-containing protein [Solirubrobacteraceae bacterium]|nr:DUF4430 domain-containing protein [Solirubrobacteraceae bacterium]
MQIKHAITAGAAALGTTAALAVAPAANAVTAHAAAVVGPKVTITVRGKSGVLLATRPVRGRSGWITRGGAPKGKCPADSVQGALNVATQGHWRGTWYASYHEYFITAILGDSETTKKAYWGLYVNGKIASKGACDIPLRAGDRVLFKVTRS